MKKRNTGPSIVAALLLLSASAVSAQSNDWQLIQQENVPRIGTFYLLSLEHHGIPGPPFPNSLCSTCNVYSRGDGVFAVNDAGLADPIENLARMASFLETMNSEGPEEIWGGQGTEAYGPDDLWLEVFFLNPVSQLVDLRLHGTVQSDNYQLLSTTNLLTPADAWELGRIQAGDSGDHTDFWVALGSARERFFRAHHANPYISVGDTQDGVEDIQQHGLFVINGSNLTNNLTVYYRLGGTAVNGVDYVDANTLTNFSGSVTIPAATGYAILDLLPVQDNVFEFEESVTLTLIQTNSYLIFPGYDSTNLTFVDTTNYFVAVVTNLASPIGIDFHAPANSLVVSYNYGTGGSPNAFALIHEDGTIVTNWSGISPLYDEVKIATVHTGGAPTNAAGFTNGVMYFGNDTEIGLLSADGTQSNLNWCTLTNEVVVNALPLRGSLGMDQTGVWSNNLIAIASDGANNLSEKGVWTVDVNGRPRLIAQIYTRHLEGVIAITNVAAKWGPWAGKILTGDEVAFDGDPNPFPLIYAIATNGEVAPYSLNIYPEDFDIVQTNQDLYCVDYQGSSSTILKLSRSFLKDHVGELVIAQAGEIPAPNTKLFFVRWDSANTNFVIRPLSLPTKYEGRFEHVTFAPIDLPPLD